MSKTILVVDDDREFASALTTRLQSIGLAVETASNALTAMEIVERVRPDLICLDVDMPTGNGLGVREFLAANPAFATIPVIMCTGRNDATTISQCAELNTHHIHKSPDLWQRLQPLVSQILDLSPETTSTH